MRDKIKLEGKLITLEEIEPKFFPYVVEWRNDPELNKYIIQPFVLTIEKERDWYENQYLKFGGGGQGFLIGIDRKSGEPFGTVGWNYLDTEKRRCVTLRLLSTEKKDPMKGFEMSFVLGDYLYQFVDETFCHISTQNQRALRRTRYSGAVRNDGEIQYPEFLHMNGMDLIEFRRTKERFKEAREKFYTLLEEE